MREMNTSIFCIIMPYFYAALLIFFPQVSCGEYPKSYLDYAPYTFPLPSESLYRETHPDCPNKYGDCYILLPEDEWNRPITDDPVDFMSECYINRAINGSRLKLELTGENVWGDEKYHGMPFSMSDENTPLMTVRHGVGSTNYSKQSDMGPFRIPWDATIQNSKLSDLNPTSGDRHVLVVDLSICELFEMYKVERDEENHLYRCGSSAKFDLKISNNKRPDGWTSACEGGTPMFPGLLRYEEAFNDDIKHALSVMFNIDTPDAYVYPGNHFGDEVFPDDKSPPLGTRFRLKSEYDETLFADSPVALGIIHALKKYGMIYMDFSASSGFMLYGMSHPGFEEAKVLFHDGEVGGTRLDGSNFEVVQSPFEVVYKHQSASPNCSGRIENENPSWEPPSRAYLNEFCGINSENDIEEDVGVCFILYWFVLIAVLLWII